MENRSVNYLKKIIYYLKIWTIMAKNSFIANMTQRLGFLIFFSGKALRFIFFISFIYFTVRGAKSLAGYNLQQVLFFFLTFNLLDSVSQFLFRGVYTFRRLIISGGFDLILTKPNNALFRSLLGGTDIIDLFTIPPYLIALIYVGIKLQPNPSGILFYIILFFNGLFISAAFHIAVLALGIITLEMDHTMMIYRDLSSLGRWPLDIYSSPIRLVLIYLIPIGVMVTIPAKAYLGLITPYYLGLSFLLSIVTITLSLNFWNFALRKYSSASS